MREIISQADGLRVVECRGGLQAAPTKNNKSPTIQRRFKTALYFLSRLSRNLFYISLN